jgi:hypothetical protein
LSYVDEIIKLLPPSLLAVKCNLSGSGSADIAWHYHDAKEVLHILKENNKIILGGEVYTPGAKHMDLTWDAWDYDSNPKFTNLENAEKSYEVALNYMESYHKRNGDNFCFSIVI